MSDMTTRMDSEEVGSDGNPMGVNFDGLHNNGRYTIVDLAMRVTSEAEAWKLLEELRWGSDRRHAACPHCDCQDVKYIEPSNGETRKAASGVMSARRVWRCRKRGGGCGKQFTATVGTIMHRSKTPVRVWLFVMFEMMSSKNGVAAREIQRKYKVSQKTAWHMLHRIREAMGAPDDPAPMRGTVKADETFFGGKVNKMNKARKAAFHKKHDARPGGATGTRGKQAVISLLNPETGEVRSKAINDVTAETLRTHLLANTVPEVSDLETDERKGYAAVGREFASHTAVDHSRNMYAKGKATTNQVESYFSQLKRSIDGTHHHCSSIHLDRYLGEFDYRYSTRKMTDSDRFVLLCQRPSFERTLPYTELTAHCRRDNKAA